MIFLRVHRKGSILNRPVLPMEHWGNNNKCPGPIQELFGDGLPDWRHPVMVALKSGWCFGATRQQFRRWWPRCILNEFVTWDDHEVSLIYVPPGAGIKLRTQVIFDPKKARVIRTLTKDQVLYLTRKNRKCPRNWKKELFS